MSDHDTIFALSTAPGRSGVAVVRVSGPRSRAALAALGGPADPEARRAVLVDLRSPEGGGTIDRALVLAFAEPHSFTGEDVVELHLHGGPAVVRAALEALAGIDPRKAQVVELKFYAGLEIDQIAEVVGVSHATVERDWAFSRAWLRTKIAGD